MDLRKLRHMAVLAEELNFARAAEKVNLTQSALSRSIQALEDELGSPLFDRDLRGVTLTPIGKQVLQRAQALLLEASNLQRDVALMRNAEFGDVAFGAGPFPGATFLPPILAELARDRPQLHVEVEVNNWEYLMQHLLDERIEFFIADVRSVPGHPRVSVTRLARQYGALFCRAGHPLAGRRLRSANEVLAYPLASVRLPPEILKQLTSYLGVSNPAEWTMNLCCDNPALLQYVAANSDTLLASTYAAVTDALARGALIPVEMPDPPALYAEMGVVSLSGRTLSPAARWLVEKMRERAEQLAAQLPVTAPAARARKRH
ncbi:MAG: LysR family transcriptional regulator [Noviherbaspirillum sp.]